VRASHESVQVVAQTLLHLEVRSAWGFAGRQWQRIRRGTLSLHNFDATITVAIVTAAPRHDTEVHKGRERGLRHRMQLGREVRRVNAEALVAEHLGETQLKHMRVSDYAEYVALLAHPERSRERHPVRLGAAPVQQVHAMSRYAPQ